MSGGPSWSGLYGPVSWLIFFQFEPHDLVRSIQRESSRVAPMEIRPPGFLIRGWSQEMWFRPLLGGGCVNSTVRSEQTDGRNLPPDRHRRESNSRPPICRSRALPTIIMPAITLDALRAGKSSLQPNPQNFTATRPQFTAKAHVVFERRDVHFTALGVIDTDMFFGSNQVHGARRSSFTATRPQFTAKVPVVRDVRRRNAFHSRCSPRRKTPKSAESMAERDVPPHMRAV